MSKSVRISKEIADQILATARPVSDVGFAKDTEDAQEILDEIADTLDALQTPLRALLSVVARHDDEDLGDAAAGTERALKRVVSGLRHVAGSD